MDHVSPDPWPISAIEILQRPIQEQPWAGQEDVQLFPDFCDEFDDSTSARCRKEVCDPSLGPCASSPMDGPPLLEDGSLPSTPPVMSPLEWYLYDVQRHETLAMGIFSNSDAAPTSSINHDLELDLLTGGPSAADAQGEPFPRADKGVSEANPLARFLADHQSHEFLACKMGTVTTGNMVIEPDTDIPMDAASPGSGSSITVGSGDEAKILENDLKFRLLKGLLDDTGLGHMDLSLSQLMHFHRQRAPDRHRLSKAIRIRMKRANKSKGSASRQ